MKYMKMMLVVGMIIWLFTGCKTQYDTTKESDLEYEILAEEEYPKQVEEIINGSKVNNFRKTYDDGECMYLIIGYGAQPTSGYSIEIQEVYQSSNAIFITSMLKGPAHGEPVVEEENYPYIVVRIVHSEKPVVYQ